MDPQREHGLTLTGRHTLQIVGVKHVDSFDDGHIVLNTDLGRLVLRGRGLKIQHLDLDQGGFAASGEVDQLIYSNRVRGGAGDRGQRLSKLWR
jgi:sporulation protein YabP